MATRTGIVFAGALFASCSLFFAQTSKTNNPEHFFRAIRSNDLSQITRLAVSREAVNVADNQKTTPLHYAALYGSTDSVRILLASGADPNAQDLRGSTPLVYAAFDLNKTRQLVEKGAAVNTPNHIGQTALIVASSAHGNSPTVKYLLQSGADLHLTNNMRGTDALLAAANFGDEETVRILQEHGADMKVKDKASENGLLYGAQTTTDGRLNLFLRAGADVNQANTFNGMVKNGPIALVGLTPLILAAPYSDQQTIGNLLKAGARVNDADIRKLTPLMLAVATDHAKPETVRQLLAAGADVNATDENGESALDWALKFRNPQIVDQLKQAGAKAKGPVPPPARPVDLRVLSATEALTRSGQLMTRTGQTFFREGGGCTGCHHQPMAARAYASAHNAGLIPDEAQRRLLTDGIVAARPQAASFWSVLIDSGGDFDIMLHPLNGLADLRVPANRDTDLMLNYLAARQMPSGEWHMGGIARPPIEDSDITRTAAAIRIFKTYGWAGRKQEFDERTARAMAWLRRAKPETNYERAERLMGLFYGEADSREIREAAAALLSQQKADGGWAQTNFLHSDAYATGMALHALYVTGLLKADDENYRRGTAYLLSTQFPDGSWYVRSRAPKFQPYFQSGFPFNHDQWISSTATGWAAMALIPAAALEQTTSLG